jgi:hypothetical protein
MIPPDNFWFGHIGQPLAARSITVSGNADSFAGAAQRGDDAAGGPVTAFCGGNVGGPFYGCPVITRDVAAND